MSNDILQTVLHNFRKKIDANIIIAEEELKKEGSGDYKRCMALARTKLQEAKMWVGKGLEAIGSELPKEFQDKADGN